MSWATSFWDQPPPRPPVPPIDQSTFVPRPPKPPPWVPDSQTRDVAAQIPASRRGLSAAILSGETAPTIVPSDLRARGDPQITPLNAARTSLGFQADTTPPINPPALEPPAQSKSGVELAERVETVANAIALLRINSLSEQVQQLRNISQEIRELSAPQKAARASAVPWTLGRRRERVTVRARAALAIPKSAVLAVPRAEDRDGPSIEALGAKIYLGARSCWRAEALQLPMRPMFISPI
jgi:hypothetical protein